MVHESPPLHTIMEHTSRLLLGYAVKVAKPQIVGAENISYPMSTLNRCVPVEPLKQEIVCRKAPRGPSIMWRPEDVALQNKLQALGISCLNLCNVMVALCNS